MGGKVNTLKDKKLRSIEEIIENITCTDWRNGSLTFNSFGTDFNCNEHGFLYIYGPNGPDFVPGLEPYEISELTALFKKQLKLSIKERKEKLLTL